MKETHGPGKTSKNKKKNRMKKKSHSKNVESQKAEAQSDQFDLGDGLTLLNPLTDGLGFKDKVSDGVYTMEAHHDESLSADGGTLHLGYEKMADGVLNIGEQGEININSAQVIQPAVFHSGHDGLIKRTAKKSGESFFGALIDVLFVMAVTIFTAAAVTEFSSFVFDFGLMMSGSIVEIGKLALIFCAYFLSYRILSRVFYGRSLGEWSSRHQLGLVSQQESIAYPVRVLVRELMCLCTGVFLFPILSSVVKRDIGFYISGLQTYVEQKKR